MEDWRELCNDSVTHDQLLLKLEEAGICAHLKHIVRSKVEDEGTHIGNLGLTIDTTVNSPGTICIQTPLPLLKVLSELQTQLKNAIYKELIKLQARVDSPITEPHPHHKEPLDFVRVAQEEWEAKLKRGINTLCTEKSLPLCKEVCVLVYVFYLSTNHSKTM